MNNGINVKYRDLFELGKNFRGNEYVGSRFSTSPRPEQHKRYDGNYIRLKTTFYNPDLLLKQPLKFNLELLERLLLPGYGATSVNFYGHQFEILWSVPSAGACYPVEVYVVINRLEGISPGIYYYSRQSSSLFKINNLPKSDFNNQFLPEDQDADFYLVFSTMYWRSMWKYSYRGYRFCLLDTGHVIANFQLLLKALNLNFSTYTHCLSQDLKRLFQMDPLEEPIGIIAVKSNKNTENVKQQAIEKQLHVEQLSRCINMQDVHIYDFDWEPLWDFQHKIQSSTDELSSDWLASYQLPTDWNNYNQLLNLIFSRRSASYFRDEEVEIDKIMSFIELFDRLHSPFKIYAIVNNVQSLDPGTYSFDKNLKLLKKGDFRSKSVDLCVKQEFVYNASVVLFFVIDKREITNSYYRKLKQRLVEVGSITQMLYLKAEELNLGFSAIAGYYDEEAKMFFDLQEDKEVVYAGALGYENHQNLDIKKDRYLLNNGR